MKAIVKNSIIRIHVADNGRYCITDKRGNEIYSDDEQFHILFKKAKFSLKGFLEARFLEYTDGVAFKDVEQRVVFSDSLGWTYLDCTLKIFEAKLGKVDSEEGVSVIPRAD